MIGWRWLAPLLLVVTPGAGAQAQADPVAAVGKWTGAFLQAVSEPNAVAAQCAPTIMSAMAKVRNAASARAALPAIRPCSDRIRSAYAWIPPRLDALPVLDPNIETAAGFSSQRFINDQRRLALASIAYVDDLNSFISAMTRNDRAALPTLLSRVRSGGTALLDANILVLRVQQTGSRLAVGKRVLDLRIVLAQAARSFVAMPPGAGGFPIGSTLRDLSARASAATAAVGPAWESDRNMLRRLSGGGDPSLDRVIGAGTQLTAALSAHGERLTVLLAAAGQRPTLPLADAVRLSTDLTALEADMLRAGQTFATTLQTIG